MEISPINVSNHLRVLGPQAAGARPEVEPLGAPAKGPGFSQLLAEQIDKVNTQMVGADQAAGALVSGQSEDVHGTLIAMQKANLSFRMLVEVRNKAIRAYEELMRIQA